MEGRKIATIDEAATLKEAQERAHVIAGRAEVTGFAQTTWPVS